jgi:hypothetical protein
MSDFGQPPGWTPPPGSQPGGFSPPPGAPYGAPPGFGPQGPSGPSSTAIIALVLGCASFLLCGSILFSIPGAIIGKMEMNKIQRGESSAAGDGLAKAGFYVSLINIVLTLLGMCAYAGLIVLGVAATAVQQ